MAAPVITFWTGSASTGNTAPNGAFDMAKIGALATVHDFGTIDTGSSGSNTWIWIFNNQASGSSVADAILSSSTANELGLGHHASGSSGHVAESTNDWDLQSGSFTGSVVACSNYSLLYSGGASGTAAYSSGAMSTGWTKIYSGSSGLRLQFFGAGTKLSGSTSLGAGSGSAWLIGVYIHVQNGVAQGTKTGSLCVKYKYT